MGILGAAGERGIVALANGIFQIGTDLVPAVAKFNLSGTAEDTVGEVGCAKAGEPDQALLLFACCRPLICLDFGGKPDRGDIVTRAFLPAAC